MYVEFNWKQWILPFSILGVGTVVFITIVVSTTTINNSKEIILETPKSMLRMAYSLNSSVYKSMKIDGALLERINILEKKTLKSSDSPNNDKNEENKLAEEQMNQLSRRLDALESDFAKEKGAFEKVIKNLNSSIVEAKITCPVGTTRIRRECFAVYMDHRKWDMSYKYCQDKGGFMPEFDNTDLSFMELVEAMPDLKQKIKDDRRSSVPFWLDAKDEIKEGEWIWGSGAQLYLNDTRWAPGQPNNHGDDGQHCLIVDYDKSKGIDNISVGLEDNPCHLSFNILCEFTPKITY